MKILDPLGKSSIAARLCRVLPLLTALAAIVAVSLQVAYPLHAAPPADEYRLSSLRVFNRVVLLVKEQYVEPERIKPREMFISALEAVEKRVPEVLIEEPAGSSIDVVVGDERRTFPLDEIASLWELSFKLRDVFRFMETRLSDEVDRQEVEYAAVNGMLAKLDPHSVLLEPRFSQEMKLSTKGEFGGLGIVISIRDGFLTVISPIDGTPAARAGILAQDRIVKIGAESTVNMGLDEAVERLRGKPGTEVVIWIERKGFDEPREVVITRDIIKVDSVTHKLLAERVGYVKVKQFQGRTAADVSEAVAAMRREAGAPLAGLVLDLRNNPGGLLDQAVEVSNLFLRDGVLVVTQEGGAQGERREITATKHPHKIDGPVVVLVNGGSASASEIVAGAVKNRGRGLVIGDQTFGKGSVQQLYDFPDSSSLKLTIGQYLTPGDESIQNVGITPDLLIRPVLAASVDDVDLFPDTATREQDLDRHLNDQRIKERRPVHELTFLDEPLDEGEAERRATTSDFIEDFEIRLASRTILLTKGSGRDALLTAAKESVEEARNVEGEKVKRALGKLAVDWSTGPTSPGGALASRVVEAAPVQAGEELRLVVEAENTGPATLYQVSGNTRSTLGLLVDREFLFGKLAPGEKRRWEVKVKMPKNLASRDDLVRVLFSDAAGRALGSLDIPVAVKGLPRPRFSYSLFVDDVSGGNGDGLLQVGETVDLVVSLHNAGAGVAEQPMVLLKNMGGSELFLDTGRQTLKALATGQSATARFSFKVQEAKPEADLRLQVFDGVMGDYLVERIHLPIRAGGVAAKPRKGTVLASGGVTVLAAAEPGAPVLARAAPGAHLSLLAEVGGFLRVDVGGGMFGYVPSADVATDAARVPVGVPQGLSFVFGRDPPRITFVDAPVGLALKVPGDSLKVRVRVEDDGAVRDLYVFNGENKTVYSLVGSKGPTDRTLELELKLEPGLNIVTAVAREDDEFAQRETLSVFSSAGDPFAEERQLARH